MAVWCPSVTGDTEETERARDLIVNLRRRTLKESEVDQVGKMQVNRKTALWCADWQHTYSPERELA